MNILHLFTSEGKLGRCGICAAFALFLPIAGQAQTLAGSCQEMLINAQLPSTITQGERYLIPVKITANARKEKSYKVHVSIEETMIKPIPVSRLEQTVTVSGEALQRGTRVYLMADGQDNWFQQKTGRPGYYRATVDIEYPEQSSQCATEWYELKTPPLIAASQSSES